MKEWSMEKRIIGVLPGIRVSFSASLFCPDPMGELDIVGERSVGDFGVAQPKNHKIKMIIQKKISRK